MDKKYNIDENDLECFDEFEDYYRLGELEEIDPDNPKSLDFERNLDYLQNLEIESQGDDNND